MADGNVEYNPSRPRRCYNGSASSLIIILGSLLIIIIYGLGLLCAGYPADVEAVGAWEVEDGKVCNKVLANRGIIKSRLRQEFRQLDTSLVLCFPLFFFLL